MKPSLGSVPINLESLLETRLLVQANSGGGKSYCLRRLLEQTAAGVQQIVIDPEGEFATLREKFDYIICAPQGADAVATPATAAALARALWESGTSAVVDIYELKAHDRILFVRRFCESLVNAPKRIWHPTLVVIDEIHIFAPQTGSAESSGPVIDLATRGRKRGLALVGATQRIAKLNKDVAAELLNKLVGRTGLDVDVARAAEELGMPRGRETTEVLRNLEPGQFFAYGPALTRSVERITIGAVVTTHPKTGQRALIAPPPASAAVRAKLAKLEGIQREAVEEAQTVDALRAERDKLRRDLAAAQKPIAAAAASAVAQMKNAVPEAEARRREKTADTIGEGRGYRRGYAAGQSETLTRCRRAYNNAAPEIFTAIEAAAERGPAPAEVFHALAARRPVEAVPAAADTGDLRAGARRILAELVTRSPAGYTKPQVGTLTKFAHKGGTFGQYLSALKRAGFVEERDGMLFASDAGIAAVGGSRASPKTHDDVMAMWRRSLRAGAFRMLEAIDLTGTRGMSRDELGEQTNMAVSGGTFGQYLSVLRRNGLITDAGGVLRANDILYPEKA